MHVARPSVLSVVAVLLLATAACNNGDPLGNQANVPGNDLGDVEDGGAVVEPIDAGDNGAPSDVYPAPFMAPPEVMRAGGPVLDEPRFIAVFFSNDDLTLVPRIVDYQKKVATSNYWKEVTSEYGVGPATVTDPVMLSETASGTIDDSKIRTWLAAKLNADDPAFPTPTSDDIVVLHYPSTATITLTTSGGQVSRSCREFGAYHGDTQLDNAHNRMRVAYAVIPRCRSQGSTFDTMTLSESHELIEAATDPYPRTNPAYSALESDYYHWQALTSGGEVSDLCQISFDSDIRPAELGYVVQRSWSNAAAKAGRNPCVPATGTYFAAAPELGDEDYIEFYYSGFPFFVHGVAIPVGQKKTITLDIFSSGPTTPITINARNTRNGNYLSFSLDRNRGVNGEKVHLTISSNLEAPNHNANFVITATLNNVTHNWYAVVGQAP